MILVITLTIIISKILFNKKKFAEAVYRLEFPFVEILGSYIKFKIKIGIGRKKTGIVKLQM